ncbi:hypothetical protein JNX00_13075 [Hydrogenophaga sp. YM1]|uniref:hypothetical protein n=1 Tax=Hydrogenophaga sp. YM1 TaxID=2806262 RepID=UPI00195BB7A2|nr:hypothetical protein [Hydrogenophaga sp. YM1]QRR32608.1 hypothetical protein JNX00_13075 [Hydrogenophaga sp. YM1]
MPPTPPPALPRPSPAYRRVVRIGPLEADDWGRLPGWVELRGPDRPALARLAFSTLVLL